MLTVDYLRTALDYDKETGIFTWRSRPAEHFKTVRACSVFNSRCAGQTAGYHSADGYVYLGLQNRLFKAHRLAWLHVHGVWPTKGLDHVNGIKDDNRIINLREATQSQNMANQGPHKDTKSGYKGVSWCNENKKWRATIVVRRKQTHLGYFDCKERARQVYSEYAANVQGQFSRST